MKPFTLWIKKLPPVYNNYTEYSESYNQLAVFWMHGQRAINYLTKCKDPIRDGWLFYTIT